MNITKKNIIIFGVTPPPITGAAISNQFVYDILKDYYNVFLINTSVGYNRPINNLKTNIKYYTFASFAFIRGIYKLAIISNRNKIHAFYFLPSCNLFGHLKDSIILYIYGKRLGKIIGQLHNSNFKDLFESRIYKTFTHNCYRNISIFIFSSKTLSEECNNYLSDERKTYFYNTINPKVLCSSAEIDIKYNLKINSSHFNILFVGHMIFSKGCFDLLKAAKLLFLKGELDFVVTFIGGWADKSEENEFNRFVMENHMEDYIICLGIIKDPLILKSEYLNSDVFVLPTYYPYESQPLAIIDAMNAGNPIISTNKGTISEFVISGKNGYIVDKQNPEQIYESIEKLMDRKVWLVLAKQSRTDFELNFSLDIYIKNLLKIIE